MALQPKFNDFTFLLQGEVEFLRRIIKAATNADGSYSDEVAGTKMSEIYGRAWNHKTNYDIWIKTGLVNPVYRKGDGCGNCIFLQLDIVKILYLYDLLSGAQHTGFFPNERHSIRIISMIENADRSVMARDDYFLLTNYNSLKKAIVDNELLTSYKSGYCNANSYYPTQKGRDIHRAWVVVSEFIHTHLEAQGKTWTRVL